MSNVIVVGPRAESIATAWRKILPIGITVHNTQDRGVAYCLCNSDTLFIIASEEEAPHLCQTMLASGGVLGPSKALHPVPVFCYVTDNTSNTSSKLQSDLHTHTPSDASLRELTHKTSSSDSSASSSASTNETGSSTSSPTAISRNQHEKLAFGGGDNYTFLLDDLMSGTCTYDHLKEKSESWRSHTPTISVPVLLESRRKEVERAVESGLNFNILDFDASEAEYAAIVVLRPYLDIYGWTETQLRTFVATTHSLYRDSPYHSWFHAVDVLQFAAAVLQIPAVAIRFSRIEIATAIVTALVHDIDHDGVTNKGHMALQSERATFSSQSTQEKHHLRIAWLLFERSFVADRLHRGIVDQLIDATDMVFHRKHVEILNNLVSSEARFIESEAERIELLVIVMKSADLSNTVRLGTTARTWGTLLGDEFSLAFQREQRANVPSERSSFPNGDPTAAHDSTQLAFYTHVIVPFYTALASTPIFNAFYQPFVTNAQNGVSHFAEVVERSKSPNPPLDLQP